MNRPAWSERPDAKAIQFMTLDIIAGILAFTETPREMGAYLTQKVRELVGARCVILLQAPAAEGGSHQVVCVEPATQRDALSALELDTLASAGRDLEGSTLWTRGELRPEVDAVLHRAGFASVIATPLRVGRTWVGALLALNLLDLSRSEGSTDTLDILSPVVALVLRNAGIFETQEEHLLESREQYRKLFDEAVEGIALLDPERDEVVDCNQAFLRLTGLQRGDAVGASLARFHGPEEHEALRGWMGPVLRGEVPAWTVDTRLRSASGADRPVELKLSRIELAGRPLVMGLVRDLTEERQREFERETTLTLLRLLNEPNNTHELIGRVTRFIQEWSGCEAVGIRLREGEDYPYYETRGFPSAFVAQENRLCVRDPEGEPVRDGQGNPVLECMCGNVLCGRFNPELPFFTVHGSFWSNSTSALLARTTEQDRQARTRNRCNGEGYESVALIPLRAGDEVFGLLQLNDHAPDRFTLERIAILEGMGDQIALALSKRQANTALRHSERRFRNLSEAAGEFLWETDASGKLVFVSPQISKATGYAPEEMIGHQPFEFMAAEEADRIRALEGDHRNFQGREVPLTAKSGRRIWTSMTQVQKYDSQGRSDGFFGAGLDITERKLLEETRTLLAKAEWLGSGDDFFPVVARFLAVQLGVDYVCIDRLEGDHLRAETLAVWFDGRFEDNVAYTLKDTPCGEVVARGVCCFPSGVRHRFPQDPVLQDMGAESYLGTTLWGSTGQPIGLIALIGRRPIEDPGTAQSMLGLIAVRAAGELERRQAELELAAATGRLALAQRAAQAGLWNWDVPSGRLTWSPELFALLGLSMQGQEASFDLWRSAVHPEDRDEAEARIAEALRDHLPLKNEYRVLRPSGDVRHIQALGDSEYDPQGAPLRMSGICIDVTRLREAEASQRASDARFAQLFRSMNEGFAHGRMIFADGRPVDWEYLDVNPSFERQTGFRQTVGKRATELLPGLHDSNPELIETFGRVARTGQPEALEAYLPALEAWFSISAFSPGEGFFVAMFQVITERKRAEQALRESESTYRGIIETALDGFWEVDAQGCLAHVNEAYCRMSGYRPEELIGMPFARLEARESATETAARLRHLMAAGADRFETLHRRKDGSVYDLEISAQMHPDQPGRIIAFLRDVTERKQAEEALRESESRVRTKLDAVLAPAGDLGVLELADIIDAPAIQGLMDHFHALTRMGIGIIDLKGRVLVGTGWQDICTRYHRVHPEACASCVESDLILSSGVAPGTFKLYKCKNHLWDMVTPIHVGGAHVGNLFLGQFLFEGEALEVEVFREQARRFGFDEAEYLEALERIPRWSRETVAAAMGFYAKFAAMISELSYSRLKLARTLAEQQRAEVALRESEDKFAKAFHKSPILISISTVAEGRLLDVNDQYCQVLEWSREDVIGRSTKDLELWVDPAQRERLIALLDEQGFIHELETQIRSKSGKVLTVLFSVDRIQIHDQSCLLVSAMDITDRIAAREELEKNKALLRQVLDTLPVPVYGKDLDGRYFLCNASFPAFLGCREEDVLSHTAFDLAPPHLAERYHHADLELMKAGRTQQYETVVEGPIGQRHVLFTKNLMRGSQGEVTGLVGAILDITDRKRAEEELRANEAKLEMALRATRTGIWTWDIVADRRYFDEQACRLLGLGEGVFTGTQEDFLRLVEPEDRDLIRGSWERTFREDHPFETEFRVRWKDGSLHVINSRGQLTRGESGQPLGAIGTLWDLTERKALEEAARKGHERFRNVFMGAPFPIMVHAEDGTILAINDAWTEVSGYTLEDVPTMDAWARKAHPEDIDFVLAHNQALYGITERVVEGEYPMRTKDGSIRIWDFASAPLERMADERRVIISMARDVTNQREVEEALRLKSDELERYFHESLDLLCIADTEGYFHRLNPEWEKVLGYPLDELNGRRFLDLVHPEDLPDTLRAVAALGSEQDVAAFVNRYRCKDGSYRWIEWRAHPIGGMIYATARDITEQRRLEDELRESESRFRKAIAGAPFPILIHAEDGGILTLNEAWTHFSGYTQADIPTVQDWLEQAYGAQGDQIRSGIRRLFELESRVDEGDFVLRTKQGEFRTWDFASAPLGRLADGRRILISMARDVTDQRAMESALKTSEQKYRGLFDTMQEGFALHEIITDAGGKPVDYRYLEVNPAFESLTGLPRERWLGRTVQEVIPGTESHWIETYGRVALTGEPVRLENFSEALGRWYQVFAYSPAPRQFAVLVSDITERKQAEEALREAQARWQFALEGSGDGVWDWNVSTNQVYFSPQWKAMLGFEPHEIGSALEEWDKRIHPEDREQCLADLERHFRGETPVYVSEHRVWHKDGSYRWILDRGKVVEQGPEGRPLRVIGTHSDITERKRLETALEKRIVALTRPLGDMGGIAFDDLFNLADIHRLQDEFAEAAGVASIITRPDGTPLTRPSRFTRLCSELIRTNERGCRNCYASDAALGGHHPDGPIVQPCLSGGLWDAGASIAVGGHHIANWLIGQVRDETQTPERMRAYAREIGVDEKAFLEAFQEVPSMSRDRFGRAAQALFTLANQLSDSAYQNIQQARFITESQAAEAEIRRLAEELEQRVKDRTAQLEAANRELEAFSYSVSHDLRGPLRGIDGFPRALREDYQDRLDEAGRHYLERIRGGTQRMGQLIDDLLKLSRVTRSELDRMDIDVSGLCEKVAEELARARPDRRVEVRIQPGLRAQGDRRLLQVVLENLLGNAWKFTSRREEAVVTVGESLQTDGERAFFIQDNGAGFDPAYVDKLFNAFQRLHSTAEFEGTGIGLAIVQRIIHRHGGRVWAEAEPGRGACFHFTLPG